MKFKHIVCAAGLLAAGFVYAATGSGENTGAEVRKKVEEASAVRLFAGRGRGDDGRISMKCSVVRCDSAFVLRARILKGDFAVQVVRPGLCLVLKNGGSITLEPERKSACCGDWAAGRWNNVSFRLSESEVELLEKHDVVSVVISTDGASDIERELAPGKQGAIGGMLRSVGR